MLFVFKKALEDAGAADFLTIDIKEREDCDAIQNYLEKITGGRTVS